jgi:hypothetical protein
VFLAIVLLLLLGLSWTGLWDELHQIRQSHTIGQQAQTIAQIAYGLLSLLGVLTSFRARRWGPLILGCWAVSLSLAAGLASVVWGGTNLGIGLLSAGATLLVALATIWLLRVGLAA